MADGRKRREAKQARRDARRNKVRREETSEAESPVEAPLIDEVRHALDGGQPIDLLGLVSMLIVATTPNQLALMRQSDAEDSPSLDELVEAFIEVPASETTALLTVFGELVSDDDVRTRCRREVEARNDSLPHWLTALAQTSVHRVVRMKHVLGDSEELLIGVRFADGQEMTGVVSIDHLMMSEVRDAFFVPDAIDVVLAAAQAGNTDPDISFVDGELADGRIDLQNALEQPLAEIPLAVSDTWPACRALVQWLTRLMPVDGSAADARQRDSAEADDVINRFFASTVGASFNDLDHRELLQRCIGDGTGDPLRWSAARLRKLLNATVGDDQLIAVEAQLDVPDLMRAFVPFAHAESGIRQELTAEALAAIDEMADRYRAAVSEEAL